MTFKLLAVALLTVSAYAEKPFANEQAAAALETAAVEAEYAAAPELDVLVNAKDDMEERASIDFVGRSNRPDHQEQRGLTWWRAGGHDDDDDDSYDDDDGKGKGKGGGEFRFVVT